MQVFQYQKCQSVEPKSEKCHLDTKLMSMQIQEECSKSSKKKCRKCGYKKTCHKNVCKAINNQCYYCLRWNHFPKSLNCKSKRKHKNMRKKRVCLQANLQMIQPEKQHINTLHLRNEPIISEDKMKYVNEWIAKQENYLSLKRSFHMVSLRQRYFLLCYILFNLRDILKPAQIVISPFYANLTLFIL